MKRAVTILMLMMILINLIGCGRPKGTIIENFNESGLTLELKEWSAQSKYELSLNENDELQIDIANENGSIGLDIHGKNGSKVYTGNQLKTSMFTVKVSEADAYIIQITGENATGNVVIKDLSK